MKMDRGVDALPHLTGDLHSPLDLRRCLRHVVSSATTAAAAAAAATVLLRF